jgi:hypothetical protein
MIIFSEEDHKYKHLESGNLLFGWTSFIKRFSKPFDSENQSKCSAYKLYLGSEEYNKLVKSQFGKLYNLDTEEVAKFLSNKIDFDIEAIRNEILYEWEYSKILGSKFHKEQEDLSYSRGFEINPFTGENVKTIFIEKKYDNQSLCDNLYDLEDGYYPELLVWDYSLDQSQTIVTQIDKCFIKTENGARYVDVDDFKTNSKRPYESKDSYLKYPLDSVFDNTAEKYKLQVMFGAKLMSTFGFVPRFCAFTHYLNYDINKSMMYNAKYNSELMDKLQLEWTNILNTNTSTIV